MARKEQSPFKVPPQNVESEQALLGAVMLKPDVLNDVVDILSPDAFYSERHRLIYRAMLELSARYEPIDLLSLTSRLREKNLLESIGGSTYLTELVDAVPTASNAKHYASLVQKKYMMRSLIAAAEFISELGFDENRELEEIIDEAEKKIYEVTNTPTLQKFIGLHETLGEAWDRLDKLHKSKDEVRGVRTGFHALDNILAGLQKSDLVILAARPSMGKTALALDIARQTATHFNTPVGIFSLEMSAQQLVDRILASEAHVDAWKLRTGKLSTDDEFDRIRDSLDRLSRAPLFIDDQPGNNILKMRSVARRLKNEHGLGLIIVDYLQLMAPTATRASDSLVQQVTEISKSLKNLARELDVPVLALSQLSRAIEQRRGRPRLSDLRDSGCLTGDTLIIRADTGERVPIRDLVGQKDIPLFSLDSSYRLRPMLASKVFPSGRKQTFTLTTRSGRTINASGNHQFFTLHGWQRLDALQEEDRIALPRALPGVSSTSPLSRNELILLAHLIGDGCVLPRQPIHYTSADPENLDVVENAAHALFGITPRRVKQKNWWHTYLPSPYRLARGKRHPITSWFSSLGVLPVHSYSKRVPNAVFHASDNDIRLFLRHLWATDGNISWKRLAGRRPAAAIYYGTTSRQLANGIQHLLLRLGIWSTIRTASQGQHRPSYQVHIQSTPVQLSFLEQVGCHGKRGHIVPELIAALRDIAPMPNTDSLPKEVWKLFVEPAKKTAGISWRDVATSRAVSYNGSALFASGISRNRLTELARELADDGLLHLAESDVYWDEIVSITPRGIEEVYDMTVPGTHNFVANDIIVHNSIEQDADVVMFIHREDKYDENSDKKNIAEILVEKHRNGPVGSVELYFDEKKTTFLNIDKSDFGSFEVSAAGATEDF